MTRRKEIIKTTSVINKIESKKRMTQQINEFKSWLFEKENLNAKKKKEKRKGEVLVLLGLFGKIHL